MKQDLPLPKVLLAWQKDAGLGPDLKERINFFVKRRKRRRKARATAAVLVAVTLGGLFWAIPYVKDTSAISTPAATRQTLALQDGSTAELNARSHLRTDFRYSRRIATLSQGEAFFSVAKDPVHPFLVRTPGGTVQVIGTQFNVRVTDGGKTEVTLFEGKVAFLNPDSRSQLLLPGEQVTTGDAPRTLTRLNLQDVQAWRTGFLALNGLSLKEAMARLSAYLGKPITVSPLISSLRPGGVFPVDDLPTFFHALQGALPVKVMQDDDGYRVDPR